MNILDVDIEVPRDRVIDAGGGFHIRRVGDDDARLWGRDAEKGTRRARHGIQRVVERRIPKVDGDRVLADQATEAVGAAHAPGTVLGELHWP